MAHRLGQGLVSPPYIANNPPPPFIHFNHIGRRNHSGGGGGCSGLPWRERALVPRYFFKNHENVLSSDALSVSLGTLEIITVARQIQLSTWSLMFPALTPSLLLTSMYDCIRAKLEYFIIFILQTLFELSQT